MIWHLLWIMPGTGLVGYLVGRWRCGEAREHEADARYWRAAYEGLVGQTGRDLNDGLGRDPRRAAQPKQESGT